MTDQYTQQDPTTQYPQPNFGEQKLEHPGLEPEMRPGGSIINTTSIEAYQPEPGLLDYASTKGAIVTLRRGLPKT